MTNTIGDQADAEDLAEGTLLSHLVELRSRLLKIAATVLLIFVPLVPFAQRIFAFAADPLSKVLPGGKLISTDPVAPIFTPFKLTLYLALIIAMPVVLYQVWAFVAPGLYKKERRGEGEKRVRLRFIKRGSSVCGLWTPDSRRGEEGDGVRVARSEAKRSDAGATASDRGDRLRD